MTINRLSVRAAFLAVSSAAAVLLSATGCRHSDIVELPLTWHEGFGPFDLSFSGDRAYNPDSDASAPAITGFPDGMSEIRTGIFETNILQTCYEDHIAGRMSDERYGHLLEAWGWIPDTTVLSRNHVDTQIAFAVGKCQDGALCIAVDTDGDSDLSDEKPLVLTETDSLFNSAERDSILSANTVIATVEQYDGKSIKREEIDHVFDKYYTTAKKFRKVGTGLGLYLSNRIVKAHNGEIIVETDSYNPYTTFMIKLPILTKGKNV